MKISVAEAETQLLALIRQAEAAGDEVVLTHEGVAAALLVPLHPPPDKAARRAALEAWQAAGARATPGPSAARSQDFLYDEDGLPA